MRACRAGLPFTEAVPDVGWIRSPTTRSSVDLPHPDGPISDTNSPGSISRSMPCSAVVSPKRCVTSLISTTLMADSPDGRRDDASVVSRHVLRRAADDEPLSDQHDEEERDAERGRDHVRRPEAGRLGRVVLAVVDDLAAEAVLDRGRQLADDRADDAGCGGHFQRGE